MPVAVARKAVGAGGEPVPDGRHKSTHPVSREGYASVKVVLNRLYFLLALWKGLWYICITEYTDICDWRRFTLD